MTLLRRAWARVGWLEAVLLIVAGAALALTAAGALDPVALIILLVLGYFAHMARGVIAQAQRFRPVEPPRTWLITLVANLALMALGIGAFGWYLAGAGIKAWIPFLIFIAGFIALRQWRRGVVARLYAWRTPALALLQAGEYRKLVRELEGEARQQQHPDKLAMVALALIELNKWDQADALLKQAHALAPEFASVNGAIGSLRRHQARYDEAVAAIRQALAFEENANSRYYLGLCQFLGGDAAAARATLLPLAEDPTVIRQGQMMTAYILGQGAEAAGGEAAARVWYARMAEDAPRIIPVLEEEARRHKQTPYGDALKLHTSRIKQIVARRPLAELAPGAET